ncbi:MAG: hypothetical protein B6D36_19810 [Planctomycetes bacterium UTPLA1]|jgi:hypothetical protein|nr:MAG: hypothetical protein B6D36_19810 [Planctomycetes bacterium UTPLA1]
MVSALLAIMLSGSFAQADPGVILSVDGDLVIVRFTLPAGTAYKVDYPTSRCAAWLDPDRSLQAFLDTVYTARAFGDINNDDAVNSNDIWCFVSVLGPVGPIPGSIPCFAASADLNTDGNVDELDIPSLIDAIIHDFPAQGTVLYVEGTAPSTLLGDSPIELLTDPDQDGSFTVSQTQPATVVELTVGPSGGPLGSLVDVSMNPAIAPVVVGEDIIAQWEGVFQPLVGAPSGSFSLKFSPDKVHEVSDSAFQLVVGDGYNYGVPEPATVQLPGSFRGKLRVMVDGQWIAHNFDFTPALNEAQWEWIDYPDGPGGLDAPQLGGVRSQLHPWLISFLSIDTPTEAQMLVANAFHNALVLRLQENPITQAEAPEVLKVDVVSLDTLGSEIDRIDNLTLQKSPDDGDPSNITYHNDLYSPVIMIDADLDDNSYPNVFVLKVVANGKVLAMPSVN